MWCYCLNFYCYLLLLLPTYHLSNLMLPCLLTCFIVYFQIPFFSICVFLCLNESLDFYSFYRILFLVFSTSLMLSLVECILLQFPRQKNYAVSCFSYSLLLHLSLFLIEQFQRIFWQKNFFYKNFGLIWRFYAWRFYTFSYNPSSIVLSALFTFEPLSSGTSTLFLLSLIIVFLIPLNFRQSILSVLDDRATSRLPNPFLFFHGSFVPLKKFSWELIQLSGYVAVQWATNVLT